MRRISGSVLAILAVGLVAACTGTPNPTLEALPAPSATGTHAPTTEPTGEPSATPPTNGADGPDGGDEPDGGNDANDADRADGPGTDGRPPSPGGGSTVTSAPAAPAAPSGDLFSLALSSAPVGSLVNVRALSFCPAVTEQSTRYEPEIRFSFVDAAGTNFSNTVTALAGWDGAWGRTSGVVFWVPQATVVLGESAPWGSDAAPGPGWLEAECGYYAIASDEWVVTRTHGVPFTVSGPALRIALSKTTVRPGDPLRVTPLDRCPGQPSLARVYIYDNDAVDWFVQELSPSGDGSWPAVDLIVPPTFHPGPHLVHAVCYGDPWVVYTDLVLTVREPAPE